jgi:hypothetical protein
MPECDQDHGRVTMALSIELRGRNQSIDLGLSQVFACAAIRHLGHVLAEQSH